MKFKIPRFGSRKDIVKSLPRSENSEDNKTNQLIGKMWQSSTWDNRWSKIKWINEVTQKVETPKEELISKQINQDPTLAQTFLNEWETLEEVITNLLKEIEEEKQSEQHKQEK